MQCLSFVIHQLAVNWWLDVQGWPRFHDWWLSGCWPDPGWLLAGASWAPQHGLSSFSMWGSKSFKCSKRVNLKAQALFKPLLSHICPCPISQMKSCGQPSFCWGTCKVTLQRGIYSEMERICGHFCNLPQLLTQNKMMNLSILSDSTSFILSLCQTENVLAFYFRKR